MTADAVSDLTLGEWIVWMLDLLPGAPDVASVATSWPPIGASPVPELPASEEPPPPPPPELRPLMELSRDVLAASSMSDLRTRLDAQLPRLRELRMVPVPMAELRDRLVDIPLEPNESSFFVRSLGMTAARKVFRGVRGYLSHLDAFSEIMAGDPSERAALARRAFSVTPWSLHEGAVVPHALVTSALNQWRGLVALGALAAACADGRQPGRWLTNALADAYLVVGEEASWILGSCGYPTAAGDQPPTDMARLFRDAEEADARVVAEVEAQILAGGLGVPDEE